MDIYQITRNAAELVDCDAVADRFATTPCLVLKTHASYNQGRPLHSLDGMEFVNAAYIHIYRNPLDVLLSYINFTRLEYKANINNCAYKKQLFTDLLGFESHPEYDEWRGMSLEKIPRKHLDHALGQFSEYDMTIEPIAAMSGTWLSNLRSWKEASNFLPGHSIRYEDCLNDPSEITKLADLFIFPEDEVSRALDAENENAKNIAGSTKEQALFFNKMSSFYFAQYFSGDVINAFLSKHEGTLREFGYQSLVEMKF